MYERYLPLTSDGRISKLHCVIIHKNDKLYVKDEDSRNGTYNLPFLMKNNTENDFRAIFTSFLKLQNYVFSSKVSLCKRLWISEKDANSWDFFELNFSPTIYPPIICLKRLFSATCQKKEIPDNVWLSGICLIFLLFSVIRLGYEPNVISSSISVLSEISALHPPFLYLVIIRFLFSEIQCFA